MISNYKKNLKKQNNRKEEATNDYWKYNFVK